MGPRDRHPDGPARATGHSVVTLRPIATPLTLGFLALGVASFVTSGFDLSWVDRATQSTFVAVIVLAFAPPLQLGGAVFGFLARDPIAAACLGILGGTWLCFGLVMLIAPPGSTSPALGLLLVAAGAALLVPAVAGSRGKPLAGLLMLLAAGRFVAGGIYELTSSPGWREASGIVGLVVAGVAVYAALAFEIEGTAHRPVLPIGRRGDGALAMHGDYPDEVHDVEHEAGVRRQL